LNLPTPEALGKKLDNLREALVQLTAYEEQGAPLGLRWFLYSGSGPVPRCAPPLLRAIPPVAFAQTQGAMLASLQLVALRPLPRTNYGTTYDTLKAYLITTSEWKRSTNGFLRFWWHVGRRAGRG